MPGVKEATATVAAGARCADEVVAGSGCGGCLPSLRRLLGDPRAAETGVETQLELIRQMGEAFYLTQQVRS